MKYQLTTLCTDATSWAEVGKEPDEDGLHRISVYDGAAASNVTLRLTPQIAMQIATELTIALGVRG